MRFTAVQAALFKSGVSFVHMAPTEQRRATAIRDFKHALLVGWYTGIVTDHKVYSASGDVCASFFVCRIAGSSSNHVPVIFMDGKKDEFPDQRAYEECRFIPAEIDGCGPMVVR